MLMFFFALKHFTFFFLFLLKNIRRRGLDFMSLGSMFLAK